MRREAPEPTVKGRCRFCGGPVDIPVWVANFIRLCNYTKLRTRGEQDIGAGELIACDECNAKTKARSPRRRDHGQLSFTVGEILDGLEKQ